MHSFSELRLMAGLTIQETAERVGYDERTVYRRENGQIKPRKPRDRAPALGSRQRVSPSQILPFTFVDLFAGIGGMRRGFEPIGGRCIFTSEWNRFSRETYCANHPVDCEPAGDITEIAAAKIPAHDVLLAGFPCQPFSLAGVSKKNSLNRPHGFQCDVQGTLFFEVARIIKHHRPAAFLLENVKNLKSHDSGRTFEIIMTTLQEDLGYHVQTRLIDAGGWVPQHRERIFLVGFREGNDFSFDDMRVPDRSDGPRLSSVLHPENGSEAPDGHFTDGPLGKVNDRYTLSDHLWTYLQNYAEKHRRQGNGFGFGLVGPDDVARTLSARYHKDGSEILVKQSRRNPRRLTPRECARLMGFEKSGGQEFRIPVSDTQAYRQFGNAVVVPVVEAIARHMAPYLETAVSEGARAGQRAVAVG